MRGLKSFILLSFFMFSSSLAFCAQAADFWQYPVIKGYGPVHFWKNVVEKPSPRKHYKALFDLTKSSKTPSALNQGLNHIARAVNTFSAAGVPLKHLKFVVIIHGPATPIVLNKKTFAERYKSQNPNLALIEALKKQGVKILVCGNALADMHFNPSEVNPNIDIAASALTTLIMLQDKGYALMRM